MKKILLGTNWKMHKSLNEAVEYTQNLVKLVQELTRLQIFIFPPFTHLWGVKRALGRSDILLGAQNCHWQDKGDCTGEVSPVMLREIGVDILVIGHSERRKYFNEDDFSVNKKVLSGLQHHFIALVCVGENQQEKEYNLTTETVSRQVKIALCGVNETDLDRVWIAYEPVWEAEGSSSPESWYAGEIQTFIRSVLYEKFGQAAERVKILYGGNVDKKNAGSIIRQPNMDGLLIGRSAWDARNFRKIMDLVLESM
ncbi:triose-phosphate isomerase [candidate division KSB1 bacterium]|nr:triose-phosphate isomerase [candidate division KSB1 bacterium]